MEIRKPLAEGKIDLLGRLMDAVPYAEDYEVRVRQDNAYRLVEVVFRVVVAKKVFQVALAVSSREIFMTGDQVSGYLCCRVDEAIEKLKACVQSNPVVSASEPE